MMRPAASSKGSERKLAPMTASSPNVIEIKLDRLIDDMRLLRSQMIAYDRQLKGIEASLNSSEPSEQQPDERFGRGTGQLPQAQHFNRSPKGARRALSARGGFQGRASVSSHTTL